MKSLKSLCFEALAHGRAWDVLSAGLMSNNGAQRIEVCLDVRAENYRIRRQTNDLKYNHHIHWTLDVVSAEVATLQTGDLCLIRSDTKHRVALAWFDGRQYRDCVLRLEAPETADGAVALRTKDEVWVVQGMPPIKIDPNGCIVHPACSKGSALTEKREAVPGTLENGEIIQTGTSDNGEIIQKTPTFCCFPMRFVRYKRNAVAPIMGNI